MSNNFIIETYKLTKIVSDTSKNITILKDIDFNLSQMSTTSIIGASGSGKSTLLSILAGLDLPSSGLVKFDGIDIYKLNEDGRALLRKNFISFVFQSFNLLQHLTALENVMLPLEIKEDLNASEKSKSILARVGLKNRENHYPKFLSGGEQQRVALARAFVTSPRLLLADEPTGSLDLETGKSIIDLMFELHQVKKTSLILATHDLKLADNCEKVVTLNGGTIIENLPK